jgi:hypothetical protein
MPCFFWRGYNLTHVHFYGILILAGREVKMKRRNILLISLVGAGIFLFTTHVLSGNVLVTQPPEASNPKPALKEDVKDTVKEEENKKTSLVLKVRLILSRALPLFLTRQ